jgi:hypothetical protein
MSTQPLGVAPGCAVLDLNVAAVEPTQFFECFRERSEAGLYLCIVLVPSDQDPNAPNALRLLRMDSERQANERST